MTREYCLDWQRGGQPMTREQAYNYISYCVDDALSPRTIDEMPPDARLIGWQCGFEPMFVAVWSHLADTQGNHNRLDDDEAENIAIDYLEERNWFAPGTSNDERDDNSSTSADYIL
jgi:hypothetical protein